MTVKPIPEGYHTVTPYLVVQRAPELMKFLQQAFGAQETARMADPTGRIVHAEMKMGDSVVMLADASDA
ncbi:MAG: VOC family protein, partial [Chloroflexi bacterium]|nr:VOC family protein [Chloroflexota bacterium]